jgi:hypothetical protein
MSKRSFLLSILALILITSCADLSLMFKGKDNEAPPGYQITQIANPKLDAERFHGKIKLNYKTYASLLIEAEEKIKNEMLSDKDAKLLKDSIPKGGVANIWIFRNSVQAANLKVFDYIIFKNSKEISRFAGGSTSSVRGIVPSRPTNIGDNIDNRYWINIQSLDIPVEFNNGDSITIYVLDKLENARDEFTLVAK